MKKFILLFVFTSFISKTYAQSAMATVNGSNGVETGIVHALDDAVITLEVFPNSEEWEWVGPDGTVLGEGAGIIVSQFSPSKQGEYKAVSTTDPEQDDVVFDLIFLEDNFAGSDQNFTMCPGAVLTLQAELEGMLYSWSTNETTYSIDVSEDVDASYELVVSTVFGDSDSVVIDVMRTEVDRPNILTSVTNSISCAQEGELTLTLQNFDTASLPLLASVTQDGEFYQYVFFRDTIATVGISAGVYDAILIDDFQGCSFSYDGFTIETFSGVREELEAEPVFICEGEEYVIDALDGYATYLWNDGSTGQSLAVSPQESEYYSVMLFDANGCGIEVTYLVEVNPNFDAELTVNQGENGDSGSIELNLNNVPIEAYPISVFVFDSNDEYLFVDELSSPNTLIELSNGAYQSLTLVSNIGCAVELGDFELTEATTYEEVTNSISNICADAPFLLSAPSGSAMYVWNDGSDGRFLVIFPSENSVYSCLATDVRGNQINYIFNVEVIPPIEAEFTVALRGQSGLGSVNISLLNYTQDNFPIQVSVTNVNGVEESIGVMNTATEQIEVNDGEYFDLNLTTSQGCSIVLGDFTMSEEVNNRIGNRVSGQVWLDFSRETGVLEQEEEGLSGVIVRAINIEGDVKGTAMTNSDGEYTMDLEEDTYYMEFTSYGSYSETLPNVGHDENLDSEIDGSNGPGTTEFFSVTETFEEKINAGYVLGVLSVDWLSVSVVREDGYSHVEWEVESEYNVSHYEIERSVTNTQGFKSINTTEFSGENKVKKAYSYDDYQLEKAGIVYYRVKQVDINGKYSYSDIVSVTVDQRSVSQANLLELSLYPNPIINGETLNIELNKRVESVSIDIYSISGSLVMTKKFDSDNTGLTQNAYMINLNSMELGNYIIMITADNELVSQQLNVR